ncbi:unnamed protein product [Arctia plantaginis]|uniref:Wolframin n=1 Tax=Arctia plantaginis TaxID=874455 RepID=A0A8S1BEW2_ARCPL|nr:unnamed protein product [Arctia plantaginis]
MPVGRKRWNLHDGPQGSLRRLRNQLAEDGCAESQVVLAKQLLEEKCELEADKISNFKQALEWLICATEKAHPEARRMLRRCIRSGVIDEDSAAIIRAKSCLAASRQETVARKAARDLFASLSNGEQYITTAQLERRIREICSTTLRKETDDADSTEEAPALDDGQALEPSRLQGGDQVHSNGTIRTADTPEDECSERCGQSEEIRSLTVDNLVSAAVDYCQGELPLVSYELTLTDPNVKALDHIPLLHQAFLHPIVFIQVLYLKLLYYFGVVTVTLPIFAFLQYITMSRMLYTVSVVLGFGVSLAVTCLLAKSDTTKKFVTPFQLTVGIITILYFGNQFVTNLQDDGLPAGLIELIGEEKSSIKNLLKNEFLTDYEENSYHINWDDYYNQCNSPSWSAYNTAATQIKCSILDGANVNWEGYITDVRLKSVRNRWRDFESYLPVFLQEYFRCYYGEEYKTLCENDGSLQDVKECEFIRSVARQSGKSCHLNNLNEYTYEVKLMLEASGGLLKRHAEISILYDHYFTNFTRQLRADDKIAFRGILSNENVPYNIGTKDINIRGYEINCLECKEGRGTIRSKVPSVSKFSELFKTLVNDCVVSTKYILNFLFNPVVVFK